MDVAHKQYLEKLSQEELVERILRQEQEDRIREDQILKLSTELDSKQFIIDTLMKVIKFQNQAREE